MVFQELIGVHPTIGRIRSDLDLEEVQRILASIGSMFEEAVVYLALADVAAVRGDSAARLSQLEKAGMRFKALGLAR
jgi:hypothetical protein